MLALNSGNDVPLVFFYARIRFAFLNREDTKDIQNVAYSAKYAEKVENSKVPRGAQVSIEHNRYCCTSSWTFRRLGRRLLVLYEGICTALQIPHLQVTMTCCVYAIVT